VGDEFIDEPATTFGGGLVGLAALEDVEVTHFDRLLRAEIERADEGAIQDGFVASEVAAFREDVGYLAAVFFRIAEGARFMKRGDDGADLIGVTLDEGLGGEAKEFHGSPTQ